MSYKSWLHLNKKIQISDNKYTRKETGFETIFT